MSEERTAAEVVARLRAHRIAHALPEATLLPAPGPVRLERIPGGIAVLPQALAPGEARRAAHVTMPEQAQEAFHLQDDYSGLAVDVALQGAAASQAQVVEGYVVYPNVHPGGGHLVHHFTAEGTEDYLTLERAPATPEVSYALTLGQGVAGLRLVENTLEILDVGGTPRLRMAPPYLVGADGRVIPARVSVEGCAVDTLSTVPWGRPVTAPGSRLCQVRMGWNAGQVRYPSVLDPFWNTTGSLLEGRYSHTMTPLKDGRVLVTGGVDLFTNNPRASAEVYDPATGTWAMTGAMTQARRSHAAALLDSGKVLVSGGGDGTSSAELYDPSTGTWSALAAMGGLCSGHSASLLKDGRVFLIGSTSTNVCSQIFNPVTARWTSAAFPNYVPSTRPQSLVLPNGKVLVFGGQKTAEIYDPVANSWSLVSAPSSLLSDDARALRLSDGRILMVSPFRASFFFDPSTTTWTPTATPPDYTTLLILQELPDGQVIAVPTLPNEARNTQLFNPATGAWSVGPPLRYVRRWPSACALKNGGVLISGGFFSGASGTNVTAVELLRTDVEDVVPPTVALTSPAEGDTLERGATVTASASDDYDIQRVALFDGDLLLGESWYAPYTFSWETLRPDGNGTHTLTARAYDMAGNVATSAPVHVVVNNDVTPPSISIVSPTDGSVLMPGVLSFKADVTDDRLGVDRVIFYDNDRFIVSRTSAPYTTTFDASQELGGPHTVQVLAFDKNNNQATRSVVYSLTRAGTATYDASLQVPVCGEVAATCDSGTHLRARGTSEYHGPSTLSGACADSLQGSLTGWSIDRLRLTSTSGQPFGKGRTVSLEITLGGKYGTDTFVDVYLAPNASSPVWTRLTTLQPAAQVITTSFTVPGIGLQAVRARLRRGGEAVACGTNGSDLVDHDDLVFLSQDLPPTVSLTSPAAGSLWNGTRTLSATASDDVGVSRVEFYAGTVRIATVTAAPYSVSWDTTSVASGSYSMTAKAYDTAGNSTTSTAVQLRVDNTAPTTALTSPAAGASLRGRVPLTATASDDTAVSKVEFYAGTTLVGTATVAPYSAQWDTTSLTSGGYTLTAKAYDTAGNSRVSAAVPVQVDNTPPTVSLTAPSAGSALGSTTVFSADASDNVGLSRVEFYANTLLLGTATSAPYSLEVDTQNLADGYPAIVAQAYDTAGNSTRSAPVTVSVNHQPPSVSITSPSNASYVRGVSSVTLAASDGFGIAKVELYADSALQGTVTVAPSSVPWDTKGFAPGYVTLVAKAYDKGGLEAQSTSVRVWVDNTPPTVSLLSPAPDARVSGTVTLSAMAQDDVQLSRVEFFVSGARVGSDSTEPYAVDWNTGPYANGSQQVVAVAYDLAGNSTQSAPVQVWVDNAPPTVSLTAPTGGSQVSATVTVSASASDATGLARVEFYANGVLFGSDDTAPYSVAWNTLGIANGVYTLTAKAINLGGLQAQSAPVQVTVANPRVVYDTVIGAPRCTQAGASCDSETLLNGRGPLGPEPNQPNTADTCTDGTAGAYHGDESADRIKVSTVDGTVMSAGKALRIDVTVWAYSSYSSDVLDLYYAADANSPTWGFIGTITATKAGTQVLTRTFTPTTTTARSVVRAVFRYGGSMGSCPGGSYTDVDDLVFNAQ